MSADVILARTDVRTLSVYLRAHEQRLVDTLRGYGFAVADDSRSGALVTGDASPLGRARLLVASLRIAGFTVAAEASLRPGDSETEAARQSAMAWALGHAHAAVYAWNVVSETLLDDQGQPLDEGARRQRRSELETSAWNAFTTFLVHRPAMLDQARRAPAGRAADSEYTARFAVSCLQAALARGVTVWADAERELALLRAEDGTPKDHQAYARAVERRASQGWDAVSDWMAHGEELLSLAAAGLARPSTARPPPSLGRATAHPPPSPASQAKDAGRRAPRSR